MPALADRVGLALRDLYDRVCFADDAAAMVTSDAEITTQSRPSYRLPGAGWFISGSSPIAKIGPRSSRCFSLRLSCSTEWRIPRRGQPYGLACTTRSSVVITTRRCRASNVHRTCRVGRGTIWCCLPWNGNLGFVELEAGRLQAARAHLDLSTRVARDVGATSVEGWIAAVRNERKFG